MNIILKYITMMQQLANNISSIQNTMHQFPVVLLLYIASMHVLHPSAIIHRSCFTLFSHLYTLPFKSTN